MAENKQKREPPKRVTKIKVKKGVFYFGWEVFQANTKNWDQHTLSCKDEPRPEILERLQILANHVTEICEFGEWEMEQEAWKYIEGERAQQTLGFEGGEKEVQTVSSNQAGGYTEEVTVQQENIGA